MLCQCPLQSHGIHFDFHSTIRAMRIALITPGITPYVMGGLQRHSFNLARQLARLEVPVDLYHTDFKSARGIDGLNGMTDDERKYITSIAIPWPQGDRWPGHYVRELKSFSRAVHKRLLERPQVDFVIAKSLTAWDLVEAKRRGADLPPIGVNLHGYEMFQRQPNLKSSLQSIMMRTAFAWHAKRADYVFSYGARITDLIRDRLQIPAQKIIEIPGGIDATWIVDAPSPVQQPRNFLFLGRHERRKGIEELHAVIAAHPAWSRFARFRFIGPIPASHRLDLPHVTYTGPISDVAELRRELHLGDVLLCPSHSEGMPNSIMEGMTAGLAVIATDVGAVGLLVSDANGALLAKAGKEALAHHIERIAHLDDSEITAINTVADASS